MDRGEFQPWTITGGTLRLQPWPARTGRVVVTVDVFEPFEGEVVDHLGRLMLHPYGVGGKDVILAEGQPTTHRDWCDANHRDVLRHLFRHIDANPQATYHLRTLHPERVADEWGERFDPNCKACGGDGCDSEPWRASDLMAPSPCRKCFHRPNVAIAAGPIRTQDDADRLLPELLLLSDLCREVYPWCQPVEEIYIPAAVPCGDCGEADDDGVFNGCRGNSECLDTRWFRQLFPRIVVSGGPEPMHPDNVRCLRDQAAAAGVAFVLEWGEWLPKSHVPWKPACPAGVEWGTLSPYGDWFPMTTPWNGHDDEGGEAVMVRVGSEHSGNMLDGVRHPWESEVEA